jgi:hypothetical protein
MRGGKCPWELTSELENAQKKSQLSPDSVYCREEVFSETDLQNPA